MYTWTTPYASPTVSGVTKGTISVPTLIPGDWSVTNRGIGEVTYISTVNGAGGLIHPAELYMRVSNPNDLYKDSKVPLAEQIAGLKGRTVYTRLRLFGTAVDSESNLDFSVPLTVSTTVTVPVGVNTSVANYNDALAVAISALSNAVTSGTVAPLSRVDAFAGGAVEFK